MNTCSTSVAEPILSTVIYRTRPTRRLKHSHLCLTLLLRLQRSRLPRRRTKKRPQLPRSTQIQPRARKHKREIKDDVCPEDTIVAPDVTIEHVERSRKLISVCKLAELAHAVRGGLHVASDLSDEGAGVGLARLSWRGHVPRKLVVRADDRDVMRDRRE